MKALQSHKALSVGLFVILSSLVISWAAPVTVFQDTFVVDPASNGWTETVSSGNGLIALNANGAIFNNRGTPTVLSISRNIATSSYENITLSFAVSQRNEPYEIAGLDQDFFQVFVDGAKVFENIGVFTGVDGTAVAGNGGGAVNPVSTGAILLPLSAANNPALNVEVRVQSTDAREDHFLSSFTLSGDLIAAVPEPSSLFLLGALTMGLFHWQTRRREHLRYL